MLLLSYKNRHWAFVFIIDVDLDFHKYQKFNPVFDYRKLLLIIIF